MRLGLIGWYGHGNAGDERILHCLRRAFHGHAIIVFGGFDDAKSRLREVNACDYVLIGGGGLVLRGFGRHAALIRALTVPFSCIGISIEAFHSDNRQLIDALLFGAEFIHVRDRKSLSYFNQHQKVIVGPDLTFLDPYDIASPPSELVCGVNMRNWHFWNFPIYSQRHFIMQKLNKVFPSLEFFYPLPKWRPENIRKILSSRFDRINPIALCSSPDSDSDFSALKMPVSFDYEEALSRCSILVGMRFHSLVFACQMGIPFLSLSYQPKNARLCQDIGLPMLSVDPYRQDQVKSGLDYLLGHYDEIREKIFSYRLRSCSEIQKQMKDIVSRVTSHATT